MLFGLSHINAGNIARIKSGWLLLSGIPLLLPAATVKKNKLYNVLMRQCYRTVVLMKLVRGQKKESSRKRKKERLCDRFCDSSLSNFLQCYRNSFFG